MIQKIFLLLRLLFVPILALTVGCGGEDETQQRAEDLVGRWKFVSFGEQSVDERIDAFFDDTGVKVHLTQNSLVFDEDGSWARDIGGEFVGDLSNIIEQVSLSKAEVDFSDQGTYFVSASVLSLVTQDIRVSVEPQYFWKLVGTAEEDFAQQFRSDIFGEIYKFSWVVQSDTLVLTDEEDQEEITLRKIRN
ncbi:MAG: hypothetical protein OXH39_14110 [Candidatus Poribacteria bacterium]|nr:hypothetical protein [Candidatus Poribacteria bacterium]